MLTNKVIDKASNKQLLFKITFGFCFLLLYCLPMVGAGAFWFSKDQRVEDRINADHQTFSDNSHHSWENLVLFRFSPKPKQQESIEETDTEENENESWQKHLLSIFLDELSKKEGSACSFIYKESLLQTRRDVALFVMHHSWRTFIV